MKNLVTKPLTTTAKTADEKALDQVSTCEWRFIVPGVWRAGCDVQRLLVPQYNQIKAKHFKYCPYCGNKTRFLEYCIPPNKDQEVGK